MSEQSSSNQVGFDKEQFLTWFSEQPEDFKLEILGYLWQAQSTLDEFARFHNWTEVAYTNSGLSYRIGQHSDESGWQPVTAEHFRKFLP